MKTLLLGTLLSVSSISYASPLENIHWGFDAKPGLLFESQEQCASAVLKALQQADFQVQKTLTPEDGPTVFAHNADKTQKSLSKCLLASGTVVTTVIGAKNNLAKATEINQSIETIFKRGQLATVDNWQDHLVIYPEVEKIPAMHGHVVLDAPSRDAQIVKQVETAALVGSAAYVDTAQGRFYMSEFSLTRYQAGNKPHWMFIFPSSQP